MKKLFIVIAVVAIVLLLGIVIFSKINTNSGWRITKSSPKFVTEFQTTSTPELMESSKEVITYFPVWKKVFYALNIPDDSLDYYNSHFKIVSVKTSKEAGQNPELIIDYYYTVDWFKGRITDVLNYGENGKVVSPAELETKLFKNGGYTYSHNLISEPVIHKIKPTASIKSLNDLISIAKANSATFNVNQFNLDQDGSIYLKLNGVINWDNNQCLTADLSIETGEIKNKTNTVCVIVN